MEKEKVNKRELIKKLNRRRTLAIVLLVIIDSLAIIGQYFRFYGLVITLTIIWGAFIIYNIYNYHIYRRVQNIISSM